MKALSLRQPWLWSILHAGKRIENRDWNTHHRGLVLLHAAKAMPASYYDGAVKWMADRRLVNTRGCYGGEAGKPMMPWRDEFRPELGGIVGRAEIVDVIKPGGVYVSRCAPASVDESADSPWYMGAFGFVLRNVEPLPFVPCAGALGLWNVPPRVLEQLGVVA